ncbi:hypothetical protein HanRHA438_Chr12g0535941 [Helianthus annuus]|nr:hypothetical protein HanRHA438_Chr12g0535941 [Helianthus annuus]
MSRHNSSLTCRCHSPSWATIEGEEKEERETKEEDSTKEKKGKCERCTRL